MPAHVHVRTCHMRMRVYRHDTNVIESGSLIDRAISMPPKKKPKLSKFLKKDRDVMVVSLEKEKEASGDSDVSFLLESSVFLDYRQLRRGFVSAITSGDAKESMVNCVKIMMENYLLLYKEYSKDKRFAQFEHTWMTVTSCR